MELNVASTALLDKIEGIAPQLAFSSLIAMLRELDIESFGQVLVSMPNQAYPAVSRLLPPMASKELQTLITGNHGANLLIQSLAFIRAMRQKYEQVKGSPLVGATILDFGCGYARLLRLMLYFSDTDRLFCCDPAKSLIEGCHWLKLPFDLRVSDYLPTRLPYAPCMFDLIYAFSVFTHTSPRATRTALSALRPIVKPDGMLVLTVRPIEYWNLLDVELRLAKTDSDRQRVTNEHLANGYAFLPNPRIELVQGEAVYGDGSMSIEFIEREFPAWKVLGTQSLPEDPYQQIVYLQPCA